MKQPTLRPADIVTALQLAITPRAGLAELAERSAKSIGETHNAIRRLVQSALVMPGDRAVATDALILFVRWGVPFAFPAVLGGPALGYPTATLPSEPNSTASMGTGSSDGSPQRVEYVWPSADGSASGTALTPLFPAAARLVDRNPQLARMVSLVDLVRVGGARERDAAIDALTSMLKPAAG